MLYFNNKSKITNIVKSSQSRGEEREKKKEKKGEKKNDIGEGLIYKFLLEVKREKKQNDAESVIQL